MSSALHTTRAVVLRTFKHSDHGTVMKACTELFGARSYMVRTGPRSRAREAAMQPLSRVELVVSETSAGGMHAVRDLRIERPFTALHREPVRGVLALFAQEVFYRTLREETPDAMMYAFVNRVLEEIDSGADLPHLPLRLLVGLSRQLGFQPEPPAMGEDRFDLREGYFFGGNAPHELCMDVAQASLFAELLMEGEAQPWSMIRSNGDQRRRTLDDLLLFFRLHVEGFGELRSPEVLRAVLG